MPGRDKTGPEAKGPMTGRKMGDCTGNKQPDSGPETTEVNRDFGGRSGAGHGSGRGAGGRMGGGGRGRGFRFENRESVSTVTQEPQQDDIRILQEKVLALEKQLAEKQQEE